MVHLLKAYACIFLTFLNYFFISLLSVIIHYIYTASLCFAFLKISPAYLGLKAGTYKFITYITTCACMNWFSMKRNEKKASFPTVGSGLDLKFPHQENLSVQ